MLCYVESILVSVTLSLDNKNTLFFMYIFVNNLLKLVCNSTLGPK